MENEHNNEQWLDDVLGSAAPESELDVDESAVASAGLIHPNDYELEMIMAEHRDTDVEDVEAEEVVYVDAPVYAGEAVYADPSYPEQDVYDEDTYEEEYYEETAEPTQFFEPQDVVPVYDAPVYADAEPLAEEQPVYEEEELPEEIAEEEPFDPYMEEPVAEPAPMREATFTEGDLPRNFTDRPKNKLDVPAFLRNK